MAEKKLKYELATAEVQFVLSALNRVQVSGVQTAENLVHVVKILRNPLNAEELEKDQLEELKAKYEKSDKKK